MKSVSDGSGERIEEGRLERRADSRGELGEGGSNGARGRKKCRGEGG